MSASKLRISTAFDSGAAELVEIDGDRIDLRIRKDETSDPSCDFRQWFHVRVQGCAGRTITVRFVNAGECTYVSGWSDYRICASVDTEHWFRIDSTYESGVLSGTIVCAHDSVYLAYFEPYPWQRHLALLGRALAHPAARSIDLGTTVDGRDLNAIEFGDPSRAPVWIIARQHPGESMAEWFVEGLIDRLLDPANSVARSLLERVCIRIVPNMNPDGAVRGNLRANAAGANLNREWMNPSIESSPEVLAVRNRMLATGCEFFLDVHGDEGLPYVFVAGSEMLPGFSDKQRQLQNRFCEVFALASPDFQTRVGYPSGKYNQDSLKLASKWAGHEFGCLSLTLEMPFKDNANLPDPKHGWNGARSRALGQAVLVAIWAVFEAESV